MSLSWNTRFRRSFTDMRSALGAHSLSTAVNGPMSTSFLDRPFMSSYSKDCFVSRRICSWLMIRRMSLLVVSINASIAAADMEMPSSAAILSMRFRICGLVGREKGMSCV